MNIWEATFAGESPASTLEPLTQLVSAASLRKASSKAEKWLEEQPFPAKADYMLVSLIRRDDVVI